MSAPLIITDDGEVPFRRPVAGVDPVAAQDFVTKAWGEANLGGGASDHGALSGLADNDHPQYAIAASLGTLATQSGTFSGTSSGTNTGDQTISLTGAVTGSGTGSFATTIANDAVTNSKLANMVTGSVKCRLSSGTGDPEDMTFAVLCLAARIPFVIAAEAGDPVRKIGESSTTEQPISSLTLTKAHLTLTGCAVLDVFGKVTQNSGSTNNGRLKIKLGSTTVFNDVFAYTDAAVDRPWHLRVVVNSRGDAGKQWIASHLSVGLPSSATAGVGDIGASGFSSDEVYGEATEDSAGTDLAIAVTNQWDSSSASSSISVFAARITVYP